MLCFAVYGQFGNIFCPVMRAAMPRNFAFMPWRSSGTVAQFLMWPLVKSPQHILLPFGAGQVAAENGAQGTRRRPLPALPPQSISDALTAYRSRQVIKYQFLIRALSAKYRSVQMAVCRIAHFHVVAKQPTCTLAPLLTRQLPGEHSDVFSKWSLPVCTPFPRWRCAISILIIYALPL